MKWACGGVFLLHGNFWLPWCCWNWLQCANLLLLLPVIQAESASLHISSERVITEGKSFSILQHCDIKSPKIQFLINTSAFAASSYPTVPSSQSHKPLSLSQTPIETTHTFHPSNCLRMLTGIPGAYPCFKWMCCYQGRTLSWHFHFFTRSGLTCQSFICPCFSLCMDKVMSVWGMARDDLVPFGTWPWEWDVTTGRKAQEKVTGRCCFLALTGNREYFDGNLQTVSSEKALGVRRKIIYNNI